MVKISWVLASSKNGVIGKDGKLPWNLPDDLKLFRKITTGQVVVMGRKTYDSIGKPLPNRINVVLSKQSRQTSPISASFYTAANEKTSIRFLQSFQEVILFAVEKGVKEVMVIGGQSLFEETKDMVDTVYLTTIDTDIEGGDTFFDLRSIIENDQWISDPKTKQSFEANEVNQYPFTHQVYSRVPSTNPK